MELGMDGRGNKTGTSTRCPCFYSHEGMLFFVRGFRTALKQIVVAVLEHVHRDHPDAFAAAALDLDGFFGEFGHQVAALAPFVNPFPVVKVLCTAFALNGIV
jgi:hypothetical protein